MSFLNVSKADKQRISKAVRYTEKVTGGDVGPVAAHGSSSLFCVLVKVDADVGAVSSGQASVYTITGTGPPTDENRKVKVFNAHPTFVVTSGTWCYAVRCNGLWAIVSPFCS